jgi:DNA-binding beta-propeller fold protein YncE
MSLLVTSAAGVNGDGYGALLAFDRNGGPLGAFSNDARIADPRGLAVDQKKELLFLNSGSDRVLALDRQGKVVRDTGPIPKLNPGGGIFGPDGRYYVGLRSARTIMALPVTLDGAGEHILPPGIVPFPRGFAFSSDGALFLSSGIGPNGEGDNTIVAFAQGQHLNPSRLVSDAELSPLDLAVAPNGNIVVSSEHPFGSTDAVTSVREYGAADGHLIRVLSAGGSAEFRRPRGLRFAPDGTLYCVARDEVIAPSYDARG